MAIPFVPAANFTTANRGVGDIKFIVIHDMEMAEKPTTAEACAAYFARSTTQASCHYTVDNDSVVQCVRDKDVAWCAPGANSTGLHFEHAGFASQTRTDWLDPFGKAMLAVSARIVAAKCKAYGIPIRKGDYTDIRAGRPCIVGHWDVTKAYPDKGSHTDPGGNFPWDYYISAVKAAYQALYAPPPAVKPTTTSGEIMADQATVTEFFTGYAICKNPADPTGPRVSPSNLLEAGVQKGLDNAKAIAALTAQVAALTAAVQAKP